MNRSAVLLVFGGESSGHQASISSARNVYAAIDDRKYQIEICYIDESGTWWLLDEFSETIETKNSPQLAPVLGRASFMTLPNKRIIKPDVILPLLHGKSGEDGSVQALGQLLGVPVVGSGMTTSAVCMDKIMTKRALEASNLAVVPYRVHRKAEQVPDFNKLSLSLGVPVFVKPAKSKSSIGVSRVYSEEELDAALKLAHQYDDTVIIEQVVSARELVVAALGDVPDYRISSVGEIAVEADGLHSFELKNDVVTIIPADIDPTESEAIKMLASKVYEVLGCSGLARIDFLLEQDNTLHINEISVAPELNHTGMYAKLWRHDGMKYPQLIDDLIATAIR